MHFFCNAVTQKEETKSRGANRMTVYARLDKTSKKEFKKTTKSRYAWVETERPIDRPAVRKCCATITSKIARDQPNT